MFLGQRALPNSFYTFES